MTPTKEEFQTATDIAQKWCGLDAMNPETLRQVIIPDIAQALTTVREQERAQTAAMLAECRKVISKLWAFAEAEIWPGQETAKQVADLLARLTAEQSPTPQEGEAA